MRVERRLLPHRLQDQQLLGRVGVVVGAADDVRDAHVVVVDDDGEVVERRPVGAGDHEVVLERVLERRLAADDVLDRGDAVVGRRAGGPRPPPRPRRGSRGCRAPASRRRSARGRRSSGRRGRCRAGAARPPRGGPRARTGRRAPRRARARASAARRRSARRSPGSSARGPCPRPGAGTCPRDGARAASCTVPSAHPRCAGRLSGRVRSGRASGHSLSRGAGVQIPCSSVHTSPRPAVPRMRWNAAWSAAAGRSSSSISRPGRGGRGCTPTRRSRRSTRRSRRPTSTRS